ncbi:hypothetical protein [Burkholderia multivorans]|uniref:hypothetical protein n=1 Tax=Burkholderia multivorans TaxID=87883 RepID=UPI000A68BC1D|nr:hypothetical protein [Burkholderia multivorans]
MFTVTESGLIDSVVLMLQWPFSYALNRSNVDKFLVPHYAAHPGLKQAVGVLIELQKGLSDLPSNEAAWRKAMELRESLSHRPAVHTDWLVTEGPSTKNVAPMLDTTLCESVCVALHRKKSPAGRSCSVDTLNVLTQCVWLSEHIALCVLGVAHAVLDGERVRFEAAGPSAQAALRRTWFGVAFDQYSRLSDGARLELWGQRGEPDLMDIYLFFTKQWRLGMPEDEGEGAQGAIRNHFGRVLLPSAKLLAACLLMAKHNQVLRRRQAVDIGCGDEFDMIEAYMRSLPLAERVFDLTEKGLTLGPLQLEPGLLSIAEHIARQKLGEHWHGALGHEMARYLVTRIGDTPGVRAVEVELVKHRTTEKTPLDVDVVVVDERINRVYAVQCKHLESSFGISLLDWLERFRRPRKGGRKGLDKAVQQLSELLRLTKDDVRVRQILIDEVGLTPAQIDTIRPVVVHNIWNLDFWQTDQGICFYDLHTFSNAIKGRERTQGMIQLSGVREFGAVRDDVIVDVSDPEALLVAHLNGTDALARALAQFDAVRDVRRSVTVGDRVIVADGLGL